MWEALDKLLNIYLICYEWSKLIHYIIVNKYMKHKTSQEVQVVTFFFLDREKRTKSQSKKKKIQKYGKNRISKCDCYLT